MNSGWERVTPPCCIHAVAEFPQGPEEGSLGPLVHPRHAGQPKDPLPQTHEGRKKPGGCTGISHMKFQRDILRASTNSLDPPPLNQNGPVGGFMRIRGNADLKPKFPQAFHHYLGVLAPKSALKRDLPLRQCCQNQSTVGDALRSGNGDDSRRRGGGRDDFNQVGQCHG